MSCDNNHERRTHRQTKSVQKVGVQETKIAEKTSKLCYQLFTHVFQIYILVYHRYFQYNRNMAFSVIIEFSTHIVSCKKKRNLSSKHH